MMRPGANEPLAANAHHYAMGNYILMPQMTAMPGQTPQTSQPNGQPQSAVATTSASGQQQMNQVQFQRQFQQYHQPLQPAMGQQLILPQMNAFQMQQYSLLQGTHKSPVLINYK